ncbi:MAG: hypothetical protein P4L42_07160 [Desulfocapsaceae bacterium]|nr:hypothetical protein [Desulfocapsaceae bacterium]
MSLPKTFMTELRELAAKEKESQKSCQETPLDTFRNWWHSLKEEEKSRPYYTMDFFRYHFYDSTATIGKVLHQMGFRKSRLWRTDGPSTRIWFPPDESK